MPNGYLGGAALGNTFFISPLFCTGMSLPGPVRARLRYADVVSTA